MAHHSSRASFVSLSIEEISTLLYKEVQEAWTYFEHYMVLVPKLSVSPIKESMCIVALSLQQSFYITLYKVIGQQNEVSIHTLLSKCNNKTDYYKWLNKYHAEIENINKRRNQVFAHNTKNIAQEQNVFKETHIDDMRSVLQTIVQILCDINPTLNPTAGYGNTKFFNDAMQWLIDSIDERDKQLQALLQGGQLHDK